MKAVWVGLIIWSAMELILLVTTLVKILNLTFSKQIGLYCWMWFASWTFRSKVMTPKFRLRSGNTAWRSCLHKTNTSFGLSKKITSFGRKIGIATTINGSEDRQILHLDKNLKKLLDLQESTSQLPLCTSGLPEKEGIGPEGGHHIYMSTRWKVSCLDWRIRAVCHRSPVL